MSEPTIKIQVHGIRPAHGSGDTSLHVDLPADTKVEDIPVYLATNYGFKCYDGVKLHGQNERIRTTTYVNPPSEVTVVQEASSTGRGNTDLKISEDQSFRSFYNAIFKKLTSTIKNNSICLDGLEISFQRTIRVPDDGQTHNLPPGLGEFPIYNVASFSKNLPVDAVEKGGVFIPMYQREAMWINFNASKPFAIKIYLGGVNGISGEPMVPGMGTYLKQMNGVPRKQDYIVVPEQPWLDGIATSPGLVKQFVAMPYGSGYSIEHQIIGM